MNLSHKRKERMRKHRNQSIRWFVQDTAALFFVAGTVYAIGMILWGMGSLL